MNKKTKKIIGCSMIIILIIVLIILLVPKREASHKEKENKTICEYTRTFKILGIYESNDDKYLYVTIRAFQDEDIQTIRIERNIAEIKEGNYYEFTFKTSKKVDKNSILSLYKNSSIISIEKTDKVGLQQVDKSVCN